MITRQLVAIDGSKFQAVASARRLLSLKQLKRQQDKLEKHIAQYLAQLDAGDAEDTREPIDRAAIKQALQQLQRKHGNNLTTQALIEAQCLEQFVVGEADAQMPSTHLGPRVAYNVQTVVGSKSYSPLPAGDDVARRSINNAFGAKRPYSAPILRI